MNLCNLSVIKSLMSEAGITFKRDFGQNFLINPQIPEQIAEECSDISDCMVLEIGPGIGCLTSELAARYKKVVAIEIDRGLIPILSKTLADFNNVTVINEDVMKLDLTALCEEYSEGMPVVVCANLPYYITTPILMQLLECGFHFSKITVMVQNEVASRLVATAGSADYGAITATIGYYGEARRLFKVSAGCFTPMPKVDSAVVQIRLFDEPRYRLKSFSLFRALIKAAFEMRRKTLTNAISAKLPYSKGEVADALCALGKDANIRGERLSTEDFARLADYLHGITKN